MSFKELITSVLFLIERENELSFVNKNRHVATCHSPFNNHVPAEAIEMSPAGTITLPLDHQLIRRG